MHITHSRHSLSPAPKTMVLFLLLFSTIDTSAQTGVLMLQKKNRNKNVYYKVGDDLTFYRKGEKQKVKGEILAFEDSVIVFKGYKVHVNEITALHIDQKTRWWLRYKAAQILLTGGIAYLAIDAFNSGEFNKETLLISGSAIGLGLMFKLLIPNKIKIKRRTKLRVLV